MKTPYDILEVSETSSNSEIKKAYLTKVRQFPPERFPEMFQQVRTAFELIQSEDDRLSYAMFHCQMPEPREIAAIILERTSKRTLPSGSEMRKTLTQDLQQFCTRLEL